MDELVDNGKFTEVGGEQHAAGREATGVGADGSGVHANEWQSAAT